jgi:hypothetical protein
MKAGSSAPGFHLCIPYGISFLFHTPFSETHPQLKSNFMVH